MVKKLNRRPKSYYLKMTADGAFLCISTVVCLIFGTLFAAYPGFMMIGGANDEFDRLASAAHIGTSAYVYILAMALNAGVTATAIMVYTALRCGCDSGDDDSDDNVDPRPATLPPSYSAIHPKTRVPEC